MEVECCPPSEKDVISKELPSPGPEGEHIEPPADKLTPNIEFDYDIGKEATCSNQEDKQKESKIQTLKRLVTGKAKSKNEEKVNEEVSTSKEEKSHSARELRKSLSRVFSVSSSSLSRVWSSFSATRIHTNEGEPGSTRTLGKMFSRKSKADTEEEPSFDPQAKTLTLGRRFSATFRSAFGRSKES